MKLKGISVFEQHIEKVFVGIIFIALLVILAWQFLAGQSTIKVGNRDGVPLGEAWGAVAEEARRVQARLESTEPPKDVDASAAVEPIVKFNETFRGPVSPAKALAVAIGEAANVGNVGADAPSSIAPLAELVIPGPSTPIGTSQLTLISPVEAQNPDVAKVLPAAMPYDKAGVTIEATVDGTSILEALTADPDGPAGPTRAMPRHWWDGSIQILDVVMEREELTPTGEWTGLTTIAPLPGRFSLREDLKQPFEGAAQLKERARLATDYAESIRRPQYYASAIGERWMTPTERRDADEKLAAQAGTADEATRIRRQIADLQGRLKRVEQDLANLGAGGQRPPPPSPPPGGGGGGAGGKGAGGGGGGGGGGGDRNPPRDTRDNTEARRKQLENRVAELQREMARLVERLRGMGEDVSMYGPLDAGAAPQEDPAAANKPEAALLENPSVRIWSHDVFVERGKTYRYRLRIVLNNPMFGQGNVMVEEQKPWSLLPVVESAPSEWSEPVRVDDESYFFITSANPVTPLNRTPGARAEMFIFKWGRWRKGDVQLEPGDRLRADVKYPDISALIAALPIDPAQQPGQPNLPPPPPLAQPGPGGRLPGQPPAPSPPPNPSRDDRRDPGGRLPGPGGVPRPDQPAPDQPKPAQLPMLTERIAVDAIFLSVASAQAVEAAGTTRSGMVAYLRDQRGEVVPRYPDLEKGSMTLARLAHSVSQANSDFQAEQPDKPVDVPRPPGRDREPPPPPGGSGGGGGGA